MPYDTRYLLLCIVLFLGSIFPLLNVPRPASQPTDILIVAPHPDDAALCCAGLIQQAISKGQSVQIIELTNGEAYTEAAAKLANTSIPFVTTSDHVQLGKARKNEEYRAMRILGLAPRNITFLGYPDGLLEEVYNTHGDTPFLSRYTGLSASLETGNPYTNNAVIRDIAAAITRTQPALIVVPDMTDTALDHTIARQFVDDAMKSIAYRGRLLTYIIHRNTASPFVSDASLLHIRLTAYEQRQKQNAVAAYATQNAIDGAYLSSFIRDEEIFAQLEQP